ncbi:sperm acrosome membrane-associated protein 6 [Melopsittacus undulatus]|uniref:sperm acrosome membrane-associated protein 6 n=1 Tax=Melopsittacus undulatus TaxID=13146 RepID=UPI00146C21C6|nr:sperm acrosome membrane-associated protein 6 [Melopsittacus undulatus]
MGWWWVPLMLVMVPWLPGHPGSQARGPGLWSWVALVLWLPGVHPCLLCFSPPIQQARLCRDITGAPLNDPRHRRCLEALDRAAVPLASVTVGSGQRQALQEIVMDALHFLEKQKDKKPFEVSLQEAVSTIWVKLSQLQEAPACIPPCGYQPDARVFQCATCRLMDCQLPLDCPVQDVQVHTDEAITLLCDVPFATPPNLPITWMFAKDLHTQDLALFEELKVAVEGLWMLTIQDPTPGTVACHLGVPSEPLVRKYFYLNVSGGSVEAEQGLQSQFRAVLHWPHGRTAGNHMALLGLGLGLGSMVLVLLLLRVLTWGSHRCWSSPDISDHQTSHTPGQQGPPGDPGYLDSP